MKIEILTAVAYGAVKNELRPYVIDVLKENKSAYEAAVEMGNVHLQTTIRNNVHKVRVIMDRLLTDSIRKDLTLDIEQYKSLDVETNSVEQVCGYVQFSLSYVNNSEEERRTYITNFNGEGKHYYPDQTDQTPDFGKHIADSYGLTVGDYIDYVNDIAQGIAREIAEGAKKYGVPN
ncbi:hypothetical protein [Vibrio sp. D431a]|uniref:hypothetical protein n=1 Tax=Vibrio sp. D431a TaxID=2837388 RepID=UPI00255524BF|nr:hypothetical protein [Vibrio sp. D431a]MDK9789953.1 hypothetical protein [Vibrio sp. D431a]